MKSIDAVPYTEEEQRNLLLEINDFLRRVIGDKRFSSSDIRLVQQATAFSAACDESIWHRRKFEEEPYFLHPLRVTTALLDVEDIDVAIVCGLVLHDVVEDTGVLLDHDADRETKLAVIRERFGPDVARHVDDLTEVSKLSDGPRAVRKAMDREHTAQALPRSQTAKLLDIEDNAVSIATLANDFSLKWMREKVAQAAVCTGADKGVLERVTSKLTENVRMLESKVEKA